MRAGTTAARWTAADVVFSFETWKRLSPQFNRYFQKVERAEAVGEREVRFSFSEKGDPSLPLYVGQMSVLPKHWWEGIDASGRRRDPAATTLEPPLGSGPYRLGSFTPGRSLSLERVPDYWGARAGAGGHGELRPDRRRVLPRRQHRVRGVQGRQARYPSGEQPEELGGRLRRSDR